MKRRHIEAIEIVAMQGRGESLRYSHKHGNFEARASHLCPIDGVDSEESLAEEICGVIPGVEVMACGSRRHYWWVTFRIVDMDAVMSRVEEMKASFHESFKGLHRAVSRCKARQQRLE